EADVWAWDDSEDRRAEARTKGVEPTDLHHANWREPVSLVISPAVPHAAKDADALVAKAREAGAEVISPAEVLARTQRDARYVGITGGRGKATTAALVQHCLNLSAHEAEIGGIPGAPTLGAYGLGPDGTYVLAMDPAALDITFSITFDTAVILNGLGDGLSAEGLAPILHRQTSPRTAVICIDEEPLLNLAETLKRKGEQRVVTVSGTRPAVGGVYCQGGWLYDDMDGENVKVMNLDQHEVLRGAHNQTNAAAAYAAARAEGVKPHQAMACLSSWSGIAHRLEWVDCIDGVDYVNDSRASRPDHVVDALTTALTIYWIGGGDGPKADWSGLNRAQDHLAAAFVYGREAGVIEKALKGATPIHHASNPTDALARARQLALEEGRPNAVVMFSPGTPTKAGNGEFQDRGDAFKALVADLPGQRDD
ncbi:MAG: hypothetical protein ACPGNT_03045, partial [Rhodospirillales bacterium]